MYYGFAVIIFLKLSRCGDIDLRRQILTSHVDPRPGRVNGVIMEQQWANIRIYIQKTTAWLTEETTINMNRTDGGLML